MILAKAWASPEIVAQILEIGRSEVPLEACGVVTPDARVLTLPNRSENPERSFVISSRDLGDVIQRWIMETRVDPTKLVEEHFMVWHTHPSGHVGPSRGDMQNRVEGFQNLVVAMPHGEATLF